MSPPGQAAFETSLATDGDQAVAAWYGAGAGEGNAIWAQPIEGSATAGPPLQLTQGLSNAFEPDIQLLDAEFVVAWYEKDRVSGALRAWLAKFGVAGQVRWRLALAGSGANGRNPVVRIHAGELHVAWIESSAPGEVSIWTARVDAQGNYLQPPLQRAVAGEETWNLNAAIDGTGNFHVVYDSNVGTRAKELRLLTVGPREATERLLTRDDGYDSTYPDLAFSGEVAAVTWFDLRDGNAEIYLFAGNAADLRLAVDRDATRITDTPGVSMGAYLAWNGHRLRLAWCDDSSGQYEIYSQLFDVQGRARDEAVRLTRNPTQSLTPAIRAWREGFLLAWNEYQPPDPAGGKPGATVSRAVLHVLQ